MKTIRKKDLEKRISAIEGQLNSREETRALLTATINLLIERIAEQYEIELNAGNLEPRPKYCKLGEHCGRDESGRWHCGCINENKPKC